MRCPRCSANPVAPARTPPCIPRVGPTRLIRARAFSSTHSGCIGLLKPHHPEVTRPCRQSLRREDNVNDGAHRVNIGKPPQVLQVASFQETYDDGSGVPLQVQGVGINPGEQSHSIQRHRRSPSRRFDPQPDLRPRERTDVRLDHARAITVRHVHILPVACLTDDDAHAEPPVSMIHILLYKSSKFMYIKLCKIGTSLFRTDVHGHRWLSRRQTARAPDASDGVLSFPPSMLVQYEGCFPRAQGCFLPSTFSQCEGRFGIRGCSACWCHAPEHVSPMRGVLLSGALPRRRESSVVLGVCCWVQSVNPATSPGTMSMMTSCTIRAP